MCDAATALCYGGKPRDGLRLRPKIGRKAKRHATIYTVFRQGCDKRAKLG